MCRLLALPPGATPVEAYAAITSLEGTNKDGVGVGFWRSDGTASITKYPEAVSDVIKKKLPLFDHMPHDGWTIAHTRFKTHGDQTHENTHPFLIGDYIFAHNGVFNESIYCRMALSGLVQFKSDTDSEVAGWLMGKYGPDKLEKLLTSGGVYMGLHKSGELHVLKTTGDLEFAAVDPDDSAHKPEGQVVLASEIDWDYHGRRRDGNRGVYKLDKSGFFISNPGSTTLWVPSHGTYYGGRYRGDCSSQSACNSHDDVTLLDIWDEQKYKLDKKAAETKVVKPVGLWDLNPDDYLVAMIGEE